LGIGDWGLGIGPNPQSPLFYFITKQINNLQKYIKNSNNIKIVNIICYIYIKYGIR